MTIRAADEPRFRVPRTGADEILETLTPEEVRAHVRALQSVTEAVLAHLSLPELLPELLDRLRGELSVDTATVLLCTEGGGPLVVRASRGAVQEEEERVEIPLGVGVAGAVAVRRQAVIIDDVSQFQAVSPLVRRLASMMVAPLLADGELLGVLHVGSLARREFTGRDLYLLQVVADRVALAIRNALTHDRQLESATRRSLAETALRESEARWRTLAEVDPNGILVMDDRSVILAANPAAERIFGYEQEELLGKPLAILIPERHREAHARGVERYLATGSRNIPWSGVELPALTKSGREIPVEIAFGEYVEGGQHVFAGFVQDLTQWKREEVRRTAEHGVSRALASTAAPEEVPPRVLSAIGEALSWPFGAFWSPDPEGRTLRCEAVWHRSEDLSGFAAASREVAFSRGEGLPGRVWRDAKAHWIDDVLGNGNFPRLGAAAEVGLHAAFAFPIMLDGEVAGVMEFMAREVVEPDEALLRTTAVIGDDIGQFLRRLQAERERDSALAEAVEARGLAEEHAAELEEVQAELEMANDELQKANSDLLERTLEAERERAAAEEANRTKAEFLAAMSHELRTPLNAIMGYAALIQQGIPEPVPAGTIQQAERIALASRHLLSLIEEILSFARLEAGREQARPEKFDACDLVEEVEAIMEPLATEKGLTLRIVSEDDSLPMVTDSRKLRQILINLLDNAVKFTDEGGIDLVVRAEEEDVHFRVRDTGPGIAPEDQPKVFEPFWQADQSSTRTAGGTGLGLAVTRRLAAVLGGEVEFESEPGRGSTFNVRVPKAAPGKPGAG